MVRLLTITLLLITLLGGTLTAKAQNPFITKESPQQVSAAPRLRHPFLAKIAAWQQELNQKMATLARQARETGSLRPLLSLFIIAFVYGVLHAAGPGHGKAVATSYLITNGRTLRVGMLFGNLVALFHGLSAVELVLALHFVLQKGVTGPLESVTRTTRLMSFSLITLVGVVLLARSLFSWRRQSKTGVQDPSSYSGTRPRGPLMMALALGMVPCPGVVLVMLFCLSLNLFGLGLLLALSLTLGMAVTISVVGVGGLAGKKLALGAMDRHPRLAKVIERGIQVTGALIVTNLGLFFLATTI